MGSPIVWGFIAAPFVLVMLLAFAGIIYTEIIMVHVVLRNGKRTMIPREMWNERKKAQGEK